MKKKTFRARYDEEDRELIRWGAEHSKLAQSEVVRQALRLGVPLLVKRLGDVTPRSQQAESVRRAFKGRAKLGDILRATEQPH